MTAGDEDAKPSVEEAATPPGPVLDAPLRRALVAVAIAGVCMALPAGGIFGAKTALSVMVGAIVAGLNLVVFAWIVRAILGSGGRGWGIVAALKLFALFGGLFWLFRENVVGALPFVLGYGALPIGISVAQLMTPAPKTAPRK
jgi:hypothetical protein